MKEEEVINEELASVAGDDGLLATQIRLLVSWNSSLGQLEFDIGLLKFKGGDAPIVFWIICFLSFVLAISMLWQS